MELTGVYTVRKGKIFYMEFFWDHAEALEAAGAVGVGDVAGERGDRAARASRPGTAATSTPAWPSSIPSVEWHAAPDAAGGQGNASIGAMTVRRKAWDEYRGEAWGGFTGRDSGDSRPRRSVLVLGHLDVTGRTSGVEVEPGRSGCSSTFRDGKIAPVASTS